MTAAIDSTYTLDDIKAALGRAMADGRQGKVLITPNGEVKD